MVSELFRVPEMTPKPLQVYGRGQDSERRDKEGRRRDGQLGREAKSGLKTGRESEAAAPERPETRQAPSRPA